MTQFFTDEQRRVAVDLYFDCRNSTQVVEALGYPSVTSLMKWVRLDPRCDLPELHYRYSDYDTRVAAVSDYLDGGTTLRAIARQRGVCASQVSHWAKTYLRGGPGALRTATRKGVPVERRNDKQRPDMSPPEAQVPDSEPREYCEQLKFENDVLRAELELFAKKASASARKDCPSKKRSQS